MNHRSVRKSDRSPREHFIPFPMHEFSMQDRFCLAGMLANAGQEKQFCLRHPFEGARLAPPQQNEVDGILCEACCIGALRPIVEYVEQVAARLHDLRRGAHAALLFDTTGELELVVRAGADGRTFSLERPRGPLSVAPLMFEQMRRCLRRILAELDAKQHDASFILVRWETGDAFFHTAGELAELRRSGGLWRIVGPELQNLRDDSTRVLIVHERRVASRFEIDRR